MARDLPIGTVGMSFREGPTRARAALLGADQGPEAPGAALLASGAATGIARVETCSRVLWIVSGPQPAWATALLRAGLLAGAGPEIEAWEPRVRLGRAALDHVFRVALGLEAVVEGERAVGRQVLRALDRDHTAGRTDATLHLVWRAVGDLLHRRGPGATRQAGVQTLAARRLAALGLGGEIPVLGTGEIGRAAVGAIPGARPFARRELGAFLGAAASAPAVVLCTGGPHPWVELPARADAPLVIDLGSPAQLASAPGWRIEGLDALLSGQVSLPEEEHARLLGLVESACDAVSSALLAPPPAEALAALDAERRAFLAEELPRLADGLSPEAAAALTQGVHRLGHRLIRGAARRRATRADDVGGSS